MTAIGAVDAAGKGDTDARGGLLAIYVERVQHWRELRSDDDDAIAVMSIDAFARAVSGDRGTVLVWLRAGLPFVEPGDWATGDRFKIHFAAGLDWHIAAHALATATGNREAMTLLRLA